MRVNVVDTNVPSNERVELMIKNIEYVCKLNNEIKHTISLAINSPNTSISSDISLETLKDSINTLYESQKEAMVSQNNFISMINMVIKSFKQEI